MKSDGRSNGKAFFGCRLLLPRAWASSVTVVCALVDGALSKDAVFRLRYRGSSDRAVFRTFGTGEGDATCRHTLICAEMIESLKPGTEFDVIQVYPPGQRETSAGGLLNGLRRVLASDAKVVCLPSAVAKTVLRREFEGICHELYNAGVIVIAAWAPAVASPVPAAFDTVLGVCRTRAESGNALISWLQPPGIFGTPFAASYGTALLAGAALLHLEQTGASHPRIFAEHFRKFADAFSLKSDSLAICSSPLDYILHQAGPHLALAYREYNFKLLSESAESRRLPQDEKEDDYRYLRDCGRCGSGCLRPSQASQ